MLKPVVSKVAEKVDSVDFFDVDVDQSQDLAQQFGVQSIPTLILIKDGKEVNRSVGFIPEEKVIEFVTE
ncbi:thioredoxin family protein [Bacillaceae bacterium S4-13-58]